MASNLGYFSFTLVFRVAFGRPVGLCGLAAAQMVGFAPQCFETFGGQQPVGRAKIGRIGPKLRVADAGGPAVCKPGKRGQILAAIPRPKPRHDRKNPAFHRKMAKRPQHDGRPCAWGAHGQKALYRPIGRLGAKIQTKIQTICLYREIDRQSYWRNR